MSDSNMIEKIATNFNSGVKTVYAPNIEIIERPQEELEPYIGQKRFQVIHVQGWNDIEGWVETECICDTDDINTVLQSAHQLNRKLQCQMAGEIRTVSDSIAFYAKVVAEDRGLGMNDSMLETWLTKLDESQAELSRLIEALKNQVPSA